jgi:hypothetical protein
MGKFELEWINKDAEVGPLFKIGTKDIYSRDRPGQRIIRLAARHAPNLDYLTPAVEAFHAMAEHWGAPVIFVIDPDIKKPPAGRFLFEWSQAAHHNRSVDQSFMVMSGPFTQVLGRLVCRMFCQGGMPFEAIQGEKGLSERLSTMNTKVGWADFSVEDLSTALVAERRIGQGVFGQLFSRAFRKLRG